MKQTNNAIKFLLAQYRAIFKNAYFKGLASAVILTAGLAAAATANADDVDAVTKLNPAEEVKVDGSTNTNVKLTATDSAWEAILKITNGSASTDGSENNYIKADSTAATLSGSGSLIINGSGIGLTLLGGSSSTDNTLTVDISNITVTEGSLNVSGSENAGATAIAGTVTLGDAESKKTATLTLQGTGTDKTASFGDSDTAITAHAGSTINLNGDSSLTANTLNVTSGTIATSSSSSGNQVNVGQATFTNGTINVSGGLAFNVNKTNAAVEAEGQTQPDVVLNGTVLNISGALTLSGGTFDFTNAGAMAGKDSNGDFIKVASGSTTDFTGDKLKEYAQASGSVIVEEGGTLNVSGTLTVGDENVALGGGSTEVDGQINLASGSTLNVDTLKIAAQASGTAVSGKITAKTLDLAYSGGDAIKLSNLTVTQALNTTTTEAFTLKDNITLAQDSELTAPATISGSEIKIVDGSGSLTFSGNWSSTANISVSGDGAKLALTGSGNGLAFTADGLDSEVVQTIEEPVVSEEPAAPAEPLVTLNVGDSGNVSVTSDAVLTFGAKTGLNIKGGADEAAASFSIDGGQVTFEDQSTLSLSSGSFTAKNATVDLSAATISGEGSGAIVADKDGVVKFDSLPESDVKFSAVNGGKLQANTLSDLTPITVGANSTLSVYDLSLSGEGNIDATANIDGVLRVNKTLKAENAGTVTFSKGELELGYRDGDPSEVPLVISNADLVIGNKATVVSQTEVLNASITTSGNGSITLDGALILASGAALNVDTGTTVAFTPEAATNPYKKLVVGNDATLKVGKDVALNFNDTSIAFGDFTPAADAPNATLNLSGTLTVKGTDDDNQIDVATDPLLDLSLVTIQGSGTLVADSAYVALADNFDSGNTVKIKASGNSALLAENLTLAANDIGDIADDSAARIQLGADAMLAARQFDFSSEEQSTINTQGSILVTDELMGGDLTFQNGKLFLDALDSLDPTGDSIIWADSLTLSNNETNILGYWFADVANVNVNNSALTIGSADSATGEFGDIELDALSLSSGEVTVNQNSVLTANSLTVDAESSITVNGSMKVEGAATDALDGQDGYLGFAQNGKVEVDGGTFIIGETAASGLLGEWNENSAAAGTLDYVKDNFGQYTLNNSGTLTLSFSDKVTLSSEQITQIKNELIEGFATTGTIDGKLDIGSALRQDLNDVIETDASGNNTISWDDFQGITSNDAINDQLANATVNGVSGAFSGDIGAVKLDADEESLNVSGNSTLLNANANDGNFITDAEGNVAGATVTSGTLSLKGTGTVGQINLSGDGSTNVALNLSAGRNAADTDKFEVSVGGVVAESDGTIIENTAVQIDKNVTAKFTGDVTVDTLTVNGNAVFIKDDYSKTNAKVNSLTTAADTVFEAGNLTVQQEANISGSLTIAQDLIIDSSKSVNDQGSTIKGTVAGEVTVGNNLTATNVEFNNNVTVTGNLETKDSSLANATVSGNFTATNTVVNNGANVTGDLIANAIEVTKDAKISAANATLAGINTITGTLTTTGDSGSISVGTGTTTVAGTVDTYKMALTETGSTLSIVGGNVTTTNFTGAEGSVIMVGSDASEVGEGETNAGSLHIAGVLDQQGAALVVDPSYDDKASIVTVASLANSKQGVDVGIFTGNVFVGQNSALGVGAGLNEQTLKDKLAGYMNGDRFADPADGGYGAILYLDRPASINSKYGIVLTSGSVAGLEGELATAITDANSPMYQYDASKYAVANTIYFGQGAALAVNIDNYKAGDTYLKFVNDDKTEATDSTLVANGGEIVLFGDNYQREYQLFNSNVSIEDLAGNSGSITVNSANGLLTGELTNESSGSVGLTIDEKHMGEFMYGTSTPVQQTIAAYINGYNGEYKNEADIPEDAYLGSLNKDTNKYEYNNYFLSQVVLGGSGADVEKVARLGVYGGVAQAALTAGASTYEAVNGRMGIGAQTGSITFADNGQGAGLWVSPIYKNHDSDDFGAQGVNYGADLDLYGVALGGDYTLANGLRVGAAFNVGSGDADGQGAGAGVSNDFDYYGFTVYGGYTAGALSVVGDISYTVVDNDVEANTSVEKVTASMDSSNLSIGITGQYALNLNSVTVTPHAGLRYTNIDMDEYTVKGSKDIAKYDADSANILSIPVGVTMSKDITAGDWTVKPAFDVTLTANMGDDSVDGSVSWAGVDNLKTNLESEIIDSFTYGATLGVSAKNDNFSFGIGVNYTGASSANEYGVSANARFVF